MSKTLKLLGINCSPRDNSNSFAATDDAFIALKTKYDDVSTEIINLKDYNIEHCLACNVCGKTKETEKFIDCVIKDDVPGIIAKMVEADGFFVATPVYFGLASDLFSKFVMRLRAPRHQNFALANKVVGIAAIAGRRSGGAETTITSSWLPFIRNGCLIVGNGDKTCQFGVMGWAGARGQILKDEWGIEQSRDMAERIYNVAKLIKAGTSSLNYKDPMIFSYSAGTR